MRIPIPVSSSYQQNRVTWFLRSCWLRIHHPYQLLGLALLPLLVYFVIVPLIRMFFLTFTPSLGQSVPGGGLFTVYYWQRVFASAASKYLLLMPLRNSLITALGASLLALLVGGSLAWLVSRSDLPVRGLVQKVAALPFLFSSWTLSLAWLEIFKNERMGGYPGLVHTLTGVAPPDWLAYGMFPITICLGVHSYIFPYLLISGALSTIDSHLEEVAETFGASRLRILTRITFPLVLPALLSSAILTFADGMDSFGPALLLGGQAGFYTLATMVRSSVGRGDTAEGLILALVMIVFASCLIFLNQKALGTRRGYETVGGKGSTFRLTPLGRWKIPISILALLFIVAVMVLPLGVLTTQTLLYYPGVYRLDNLSLEHWIGMGDKMFSDPGVLRNPLVWSSAWNSLRLGLSTAVISGVIGILAGYVIVFGRRSWLGRAVEQLSFLPYMMPAIAMGAAYVALLASPLGPIPPLYGTFAALVIITVVKNLPNVSRAGASTLMQVGQELEEAATVAGVRWARRFVRILLPLSLQGLLAGMLVAFNTSIRALSLVILLVTPTLPLLPITILEYFDQGKSQAAYSADLLMVAIMALVTLLLNQVRVSGSPGAQFRKNIGV